MILPAELVEQSIGRGDILHSTAFDCISHGKFFAIIGVTEDSVAGFFFINSTVNRYMQSKAELFNMQFYLKAADYGFLRYDSFLSAAEIHTLKRRDLAEQIKNNTTQKVGRLTKADLETVLVAARASRLFNKKEKEQFFYE